MKAFNNNELSRAFHRKTCAHFSTAFFFFLKDEMKLHDRLYSYGILWLYQIKDKKTLEEESIN